MALNYSRYESKTRQILDDFKTGALIVDDSYQRRSI